MTNTVKTSVECKEMINANSYFRIYGFMRSKMHLEKTELLVYALIYSYFRNATPFNASRTYIAEWVGSCSNAVDTALSNLLKKGYIHKGHSKIRGVRVPEYYINVDALPECDEHNYMLNLKHRDDRKCRNM